MIYGVFDMPNLGAYSGHRDIRPEKDDAGQVVAYEFPDGSVKEASVVERLFDHRLRFEGGVGFEAKGLVIGPKFAFQMSGYYMNAGKSPYFHFGNVGFEITPTIEPPWLSSVEVAGDFCLGTFGRCGLCLLEGQEHSACGSGNRLLRFSVYAGTWSSSFRYSRCRCRASCFVLRSECRCGLP